VQKTVDIIVHSSHISALAAVFKYNSRILGIYGTIGRFLCTKVNLFFFQSSMADDHLADFRIITVQTIRKQHSGKSSPYIFILRMLANFLIYYCKILIKPAFLNFFGSEFLHIIPISIVGLSVYILVSDHMAVYKCFLIVA